MIAPEPLRIRFNQINGVIKVYDRNRYLVLFDFEKYDAIYNRIKYLISHKSGIIYVFSHYYNFLPLENIWTLRNVITMIKSVLIKDQNYYNHYKFLEKYSHQLAKK